jgi:glycosyltransferase involved in cell wall biosynthesis
MKIGISLLSQAEEQFTGTNRYVTELVRELASMGDEAVELEILCNPASMREAREWAPPSVVVKGAGTDSLGGSGLSRIAAICAGMIRSRPLAGEFSPGVEAVQYPLIIPLPRVKAPTLLNLHDVIHRDHPELFSRGQLAWRRMLYDRAARSATLVLTLSEYSRRRIIEHLGIEEERVIAIPLATNPQLFRPEPQPEDEESVAELRLPRRFLLYPASLWPHKNHRQLLAAFARMSDREVELILTGATFGRLGELVDEAGRLGVSDRFRHLGFVPEAALPAVYRRATALAFPSSYEGFGTPPLEAMACGCPVASSLSTSLSEVCGDAALELVPEDVTQMSDALERVTDDQSLRDELRRKGLRQAEQFSWRHTAEMHLDAYRRAIAAGEGSPAPVTEAAR